MCTIKTGIVTPYAHFDSALIPSLLIFFLPPYFRQYNQREKKIRSEGINALSKRAEGVTTPVFIEHTLNLRDRTLFHVTGKPM